jgi:hypothetical protein
MVTYDWRRCPYPNQAPPGPANYGPLAADVGTRAVAGPFDPSQYFMGSTAEGCPPDMMAWTIACVLAFIALGKK